MKFLANLKIGYHFVSTETSFRRCRIFEISIKSICYWYFHILESTTALWDILMISQYLNIKMKVFLKSFRKKNYWISDSTSIKLYYRILLENPCTRTEMSRESFDKPQSLTRSTFDKGNGTNPSSIYVRMRDRPGNPGISVGGTGAKDEAYLQPLKSYSSRRWFMGMIHLVLLYVEWFMKSLRVISILE